MYWWGPGIYHSCILLVYPIGPWNLSNAKKPSNLIKVISSYICSGIKSQQEKNHLSFSNKTFDFFQNSSVLFYQVIFDHSISCVLLIDKPNESCKNSKTFERNTLSTKKKLLKRKENITAAKTNAPISQTSSECLKLTIQTYRMRNKRNLKWSLDSFKMKYQKQPCQLGLI